MINFWCGKCQGSAFDLLLTVSVSVLLQQFSTGHYDSSYYPTSKRETYNPSVILNDKTYQLRDNNSTLL